MTFAFVQTLTGLEDDHYDRIREAVRDACHGRPPEGLVLHAAGPVEGGYRYLDVWESEAAWTRFHEDVLHPVLARIGIGGPDGPRVTVVQEPLTGVRDLWGSAVTRTG
jgi:hypothetical protein